jgi:5-methylcytosine-specific restriction endonuclease McrA
MAKRQREWAKRRRDELVMLLGGACVECGATTKLEIDHVNGRDYDIRRLCASSRVSRYWREYRGGVLLTVRCNECNARRGDPRLPGPDLSDVDAPF